MYNAGDERPRRLLLYKGMQHRLAAGMVRSLSFPRDADRGSFLLFLRDPITRYPPLRLKYSFFPSPTSRSNSPSKLFELHATLPLNQRGQTEYRLDLRSWKMLQHFRHLKLSSHSQPPDNPRTFVNRIHEFNNRANVSSPLLRFPVDFIPKHPSKFSKFLVRESSSFDYSSRRSSHLLSITMYIYIYIHI